MIVLNFSHPLTSAHQAQIEALAGIGISQVLDIPTHFDDIRPYAEQATALADATGLAPVAWQTERLLINPPALNYGAAALLAELHGRMGYFPSVLRLRRSAEVMPPVFEVNEIINLQALRDAARRRRA